MVINERTLEKWAGKNLKRRRTVNAQAVFYIKKDSKGTMLPSHLIKPI